MCNSETQRAKDSYIKIVGRNSNRVGLISYYGDWWWLAYKQRAYPIVDLSDSYLDRIITSLEERHPNELRQPLIDERDARISKLKNMMVNVDKKLVDESNEILYHIQAVDDFYMDGVYDLFIWSASPPKGPEIKDYYARDRGIDPKSRNANVEINNFLNQCEVYPVYITEPINKK